MVEMKEKQLPLRISTGVAGLDEILSGGLIPNRSYLVRGGPGTGKTTLGLHFLEAGMRKDEKGLIISFNLGEKELRELMKGFNPDLQNFSVLDLSPNSRFFSEVESYEIFAPSEVERGPITKTIIERIEAEKPKRIAIDSISQLRYLASTSAQFHKQIRSFLYFLIEKGTTVLFTSEVSSTNPDDDMQFISDGIISLSNSPEGLRTLSPLKYLGSGFLSGLHNLKLSAVGMEVFPRLVPQNHARPFTLEALSSGVPALDEMLCGGLERGTITLISGPSGTGKTTLGMNFMKEAARRGERSVIFSFEEDPELIFHRADSINIPARLMVEKGTLSIQRIEPLQYTPGEFAFRVRKEVEEKNARIIMIDSTAGYRVSLQGEDPVSHLHAVCKYLQNMGVATILINEKEHLTGSFRITELGISYMADNIIFLDYIERYKGSIIELKKAVGILKKRMSGFDSSLHELEIGPNGIRISETLRNLKFIIAGLPSWQEPE